MRKSIWGRGIVLGRFDLRLIFDSIYPRLGVMLDFRTLDDWLEIEVCILVLTLSLSVGRR